MIYLKKKKEKKKHKHKGAGGLICGLGPHILAIGHSFHRHQYQQINVDHLTIKTKLRAI